MVQVFRMSSIRRLFLHSSRTEAALPFKFSWISVDGEIIEHDTKTTVWKENTLTVFGTKSPFSNLSRLVWTGPRLTDS